MYNYAQEVWQEDWTAVAQSGAERQWSDHAEYRSELRDIDPKKVNEQVRDRIVDKLNPPQHKDMRFKEPGLGTFVVDFDTTKNPVDADVITVWGSISRRNLI